MKSWMKYLGLGVVFYFIFLFMQLPANKIYYFAEDILDEQNVPLELYGVTGSLWSGEAKRLSYDGQHFNQFAWQLHPLALLTGNMSASVRFKNQNNDASATLSKSFTGALQIDNLQLNIGATEILKMAKIPAFKLGGKIRIRLASANVVENKLTYINGRLLWSDAQSIFPQKLDLGNLVANLDTTEEGVVSVKLSDGGGALQMGGGLTLAPDGKYDFSGEFSARDGRNSTLGRSLGFIGRYDAKGKAVMKKTGNVSEFGFLFK